MRTYDVKFDGQAKEFFPIWFQGVIFSVLTFGVGAAYLQCKISNYLYGKTKIANAHLRYLVDPKKAFLRRLKATAISFVIIFTLAILSLVPLVGPIAVIICTIVIFKIARMARLRGLIFRTYNTTVGNIRCSFRSNYTRSASNGLLVLPIWGACFPFLRPYTKWHTHLFLLNNLWVGANKFKYTAGLSEYLLVYVPEILLFIVCFTGIIVFWEGLGYYTLIFIPTTWLLASTYTTYALDNLVRRSVTLGKLRFSGRTDFTKLLIIRVTNAFAVILSAGFAYPWAKLRELHYRLQCTSVVVFGQERSLLGIDLEQPDAFSDELEEVLGGFRPGGEVGEVLAEASIDEFEEDFESI
ncbi:MAG: DUF898 domain-containing protein [Bacteroidetes bacterium]|nr:DUF898 domain-containing protein [Bacteroidota bacterium]